MATVVSIMDRDSWTANTDNVVVVDPRERSLSWVPRDLWCPRIRERINRAYSIGGHDLLMQLLRELGFAVEHSICLRRGAAARALASVKVPVPVRRRLSYWYPIAPEQPIEAGRKVVSFDPPVAELEGERVHQWLGARMEIGGHSSDFDRIRRQQTFVRALLEQGFDFTRVLEDRALFSQSDPQAVEDLTAVDPSWRLEVLNEVVPTSIGEKMVLLARRDGPPQAGLPAPHLTVHGAPTEVPILMYHAIGEAPRGAQWPKLYVAVEAFAGQMKGLADDGYAALSLEQAYRCWAEDRPLPQRPLVLTFDDGYLGVYEEALPVLTSLGWPGVLNLDRAALERADRVSPVMVRELVESGWDLGGHTLTHPDLTMIDDGGLEAEVAWSRIWLREIFGAPVEFFAYPSGRYDARVVEAVRAAGYLGAVTTREGVATPRDPYTMPRLRVEPGDTSKTLAERIAAHSTEARAAR